MPLLRNALIALSRSQRIQRLVTGFAPARRMARRFVAGQTQCEAILAARALNDQNLFATLDHLGENVATVEEACAEGARVVRLVDAIEASGVRSGVSVKLTQLGLDVNPSLAAENLERIVARAAQASRFVWVDMEGSAYTQVTMDLFLALRPQYENVGIVIQSYLYRSADDVARLVEHGASVRLVKGAYNEPADVAFAAKSDTDANFIQLAEVLFGRQARAKGVYLALATHDSRLIMWAKEYARSQGVAQDQFEFQVLYGIRQGLQRQLASEGYRVRAYVPYGEQWYPYFMRRLAERPANVLFLVSNLLRA
jgi:proline dehydrogenase